jgi:glycosyltransferase involved in cell wall biosynthesis
VTGRGSVVLLITTLEIGGAEMVVAQTAEQLAARGWTVRVVSLLGGGALARRLSDGGISVHDLGMRGKRHGLIALWRLRGLLRQWRPDLVHSHMFHANLLARLVRLIAPVPRLLSTAHSIEEGGSLREALYRWTDRLADRTTQVSEAGARRYVERGLVAPHKMAVVRNPVDPQRFRPVPRARTEQRAALQLGDAFTWLAVGNLEIQKDYPTMLRAMAECARERRSFFLLIAGRGSQRERIEALAEELEVSGQVRFLGLRDDIPALLNAADGFLMSSAREGTPMALLEATATALPVVATDVGGNGEVVVDGDGGWIVPAGQPRALASAMERMMALSAEERRRLGESARARVLSLYSLEQAVDRWERLYRRADD